MEVDIVVVAQARGLAAQPAERADAVHLHSKTASSARHVLPAAPTQLPVALEKVEEEPADLFRTGGQSAGRGGGKCGALC